jgi:hypothetical protein
MEGYNILNLLLSAFQFVAGATVLSSHLQYTHTQKVQTVSLDIHLSRLGVVACFAGNVEGLIYILLILQVILAGQQIVRKPDISKKIIAHFISQ